jgi:hypothetical protein
LEAELDVIPAWAAARAVIQAEAETQVAVAIQAEDGTQVWLVVARVWIRVADGLRDVPLVAASDEIPAWVGVWASTLVRALTREPGDSVADVFQLLVRASQQEQKRGGRLPDASLERDGSLRASRPGLICRHSSDDCRPSSADGHG